jgi:hypothetical protein
VTCAGRVGAPDRLGRRRQAEQLSVIEASFQLIEEGEALLEAGRIDAVEEGVDRSASVSRGSVRG